jgi:hypothetical protein
MSAGNKQMIALAVVGGVFLAMLVAGIAGNVVRGNYIAIPIVFLVLAFAVVAIWVAILFNQRRIQAMFRYATPDRLIEHYHASQLRTRARRIPNADTAAADLAALAAAAYGQYDRARQELNAVDWEGAPAMYRARRLDILALIALLEDADNAEAVRLAEEAGATATAPTPLRDAILIAAGEGDAETLRRAQGAAGRGVGAISALSGWALSLYCTRNNQLTEAQRYLNRAKEAAPHLIALA